MATSRSWRAVLASDLGVLIGLALAKLLFHALTGSVYGALPPEQEAHALIVSDASALEALHIYGAPFNLPPVASNQNTNWMRFDPAAMEPPEAFIVVAWPAQNVPYVFSGCQVAGQITNSYNVRNENSVERSNIYVCTGTRRAWPAFWQEIRAFG